MATTFDVRALDAVVRVGLGDSVPDSDQRSLSAAWSDLLTTDDAAPTRSFELAIATADGGENRSSTGLDAATVQIVEPTVARLADRLATEIVFAAIESARGTALMLHASAIALDDGRVIGLVGPSGRGKTTAARALSGDHAYLTDETLAVRADGTVVPFPKPLSIGDHPHPKDHVGASTLGLRTVVEAPLRLAALVVLDRQPGIEHPVIEPVGLQDAISQLVTHTSYFTEASSPVMTLSRVLQRTGGLRRVLYSEADTLPGVIDTILSTVQADPTAVSRVADSDRGCDCHGRLPHDPHSSGRSVAGTYDRGRYTDAVLLDDDLLVLGDGTATLLSGIAPAIWLTADRSSFDELADAVLRQHPDPPAEIDTDAAVAAAIDTLVEARLLGWTPA